MTVAELIKSEKVLLNPTDICDILGSDPQSIRDQAHSEPALLGFPVIVVGSRTKIPRIPFLKFIGLEVEA